MLLSTTIMISETTTFTRQQLPSLTSTRERNLLKPTLFGERENLLVQSLFHSSSIQTKKEQTLECQNLRGRCMASSQEWDTDNLLRVTVNNKVTASHKVTASQKVMANSRWVEWGMASHKVTASHKVMANSRWVEWGMDSHLKVMVSHRDMANNQWDMVVMELHHNQDLDRIRVQEDTNP